MPIAVANAAVDTDYERTPNISYMQSLASTNKVEMTAPLKVVSVEGTVVF